jgi:pyruvate,water dikinase
MAVIQPLFNGLVHLAERHGFDDVNSLTAIGGGAELGVLGDIWSASRGRMPVAEVQRRHGFHGPSEGELSSRVWRQDSTPLDQRIKEYADRGDEADPHERERRQSEKRPELESRFLASLPAAQRPVGALLLRLAKSRLPMRGLAKRSFLQAFDIGRATACRVGEILTEQGSLAAADDVFYLTVEELLGDTALPGPGVVADRRARRAAYQQVSIDSEWTGQPRAIAAVDPADVRPDCAELAGIGVSAGVVEGTVRVVLSPAEDDVRDDEIIVAPFTDPGWTTIMLLASALVVDIGGALSHAAVVARELGIPCVVNSRTGTKDLRTGDRVRVDGTQGTVTVVEAAPV